MVTDVCILFGCNVPVILRQDSQTGRYELVGESYIYGIMEGEALDETDMASEGVWLEINSRRLNRMPEPPELAQGFTLVDTPLMAKSRLSQMPKGNPTAGQTQTEMFAAVSSPLDIVPEQF